MSSSYDNEDNEHENSENAAEALDSFGNLNIEFDADDDLIGDVRQREGQLMLVIPEESAELYLATLEAFYEDKPGMGSLDGLQGLKGRISANGDIRVELENGVLADYEALDRQAAGFLDVGLHSIQAADAVDTEEFPEETMGYNSGDGDSPNYEEDEDVYNDPIDPTVIDEMADPEPPADEEPLAAGLAEDDTDSGEEIELEPGEGNDPAIYEEISEAVELVAAPVLASPVVFVPLPAEVTSPGSIHSFRPLAPGVSSAMPVAALPHGVSVSPVEDLPMREIEFVQGPDGSPDVLQTCLPYFEKGETKLANYLSKTTASFAPGEAKFLRGMFDCVLFCCLVCRRIPQGLQVEFKAFRSTLDLFGRELAELTTQLKANGNAQHEIGKKWNQAIESLSAYETQVAASKLAQDKSSRSQAELARTLTAEFKKAAKANSGKGGGVPAWFLYGVPSLLGVSLLASAMLFLSSAVSRQPAGGNSLPEGVTSRLVVSAASKSYILLLDRNGVPLQPVLSGKNTVFAVPSAAEN